MLDIMNKRWWKPEILKKEEIRNQRRRCLLQDVEDISKRKPKYHMNGVIWCFEKLIHDWINTIKQYINQIQYSYF